MESKYILLTEKEGMWAEMLMQVLKDNGVMYVSEPVYGAGFALKTGTKEHLRIYVSGEQAQKAEELMQELFPEDK